MEKKEHLKKELTEGYRVSKPKEKQLNEDWDSVTGDGID